MSIRIAAAQALVSVDIAENGARIRTMIGKAADDGARLVLFCEGALSGYAKAQVASPDDWRTFDWDGLERELDEIAAVCAARNIYALIGTAHPHVPEKHPFNSLHVISGEGERVGRYDKRFLSNSEVTDWYTPGTDPLVFEVDGYRFGCAICIEAVFPAVFAEYEGLGVDAVLFASYGITEEFNLALRAHAYMHCLWIAASPPAQKGHKGPAFVCGPRGAVMTEAERSRDDALAIVLIDRNAADFEMTLGMARPWRARARQGDIYREKRNAASDY